MDPLLEDDLKRSRRTKHYQQYQKHLDELEKADKKEDVGTIQGKEVKKIEPKDTQSIISVFNNTVQKKK